MKLTESKGRYIEGYGKRKRRGKLFKFIIISKGKSKIKKPNNITALQCEEKANGNHKTVTFCFLQ